MKHVFVVFAVTSVLCAVALPATAYPPGTGVLSPSKTCVSCHADNGPWGDGKTVLDLLDAKTKASLKSGDGFKIEVPRNEAYKLLVVIGRQKGDAAKAPHRNGWTFVDPAQLETSSLGKFAPGWDVNVPMSCRVVGDKLEGVDVEHLTVLPMTVRPTDAARDATLEWQVLLTAGEAVKGKAKEGTVASYQMRKVALKVVDGARPAAANPCEAALPAWVARWQGNVDAAVAAVQATEIKAQMAQQGAKEIAAQQAAFVGLCGRRTGADLDCITRLPQTAKEAACKAALAALDKDLGQAVDKAVKGR